MIRAEYVYADLNYGIETTHKSGMIHPGDRDWPACVKAADCLREKHD